MVGIDGKGIYVSSGVKSILDFSPRTHLGPFFHLPAQWHTAHWKLEQLFQDKLLLFEETLQNNSRKMSKRRGECVIQPPSERWVRLQVTRGRAHVFPCCKRANSYRDSIWNFFLKSVQTLPFIHWFKLHSVVTRCSSGSHQSEGPTRPVSQPVSQVGLLSRVRRGWRVWEQVSVPPLPPPPPPPASPLWRSGCLWRCATWWCGGLWGCGIARLRSSTFAVEQRCAVDFFSNQ